MLLVYLEKRKEKREFVLGQMGRKAVISEALSLSLSIVTSKARADFCHWKNNMDVSSLTVLVTLE